jgi:anti-anti-sigma factor
MGNQDRAVVFKPGLKKIDFVSSEAFADSLAESLGKGKKIVLDLSNVQFVDSSGLGKIVAAARVARERGGDMRICGAQEPVMVLFAMVRLGEVVGIDEDAEASATKLADDASTQAGQSS